MFFHRVASVSAGSWEAEPAQAAGGEMAPFLLLQLVGETTRRQGTTLCLDERGCSWHSFKNTRERKVLTKNKVWVFSGCLNRGPWQGVFSVG